MEFYSRSNLPTTIPNPDCDKIIPTYGKQIDKDGNINIVETGKTNIYEKIQASRDETLVYNILDRFNNGDVNALNQRQGTYGDFTDMPKTLAEAQQALIDAENYFYSLPLDVRKEFNHSVSDFLACASQNKLSERSQYFKAPEPVQEALTQLENQQVVEQAIQQAHTIVQAPVITQPVAPTGGNNE